MALVKFWKQTYGKQTLWEAIKAGGWRVTYDGTLAETMIVHGPGATHVGTDAAGNKYYERMTDQFGRHRWVVYADLDKSKVGGQEPTTIDAAWHAWIHYINDNAPSRVEIKKPIYHLQQQSNQTGTKSAYFPKGSWFNPKKRNWSKIEMWRPPATVGKLPPQA